MSALSLIVGLGNPGSEYQDTRHNAGFMLADALAKSWGAGWRLERKFFAMVAEATVGGRRVLLCKPQTYMNASGEAVGPLVRFHRVEPDRVLVLVDDADLTLGVVRLRPEGSPGGHHGLESVEQHLGTRGYPRLKLGIARPMQGVRDITGHVLGRFAADEREVWQRVLERAGRQSETWLADGISRAMSLYNGSVA
ncbi:MAG: aminoacyl-tRNA hydrolase [Verrucomicrobia bacterium]|nr:MAG: aminoacyl-tRNA hydrolase [Verrucomicrobiota bacterium]